jgi:hypothetical protein
MAKRVYFGFHYQDVIDFRANVVRNHWLTKLHREAAGYFDASLWEEARRKGDVSLKRLINSGLEGTSTTCILIGSQTYARPWVRYEILRSFKRGNAILAIHINSITGKNGLTKPLGPDPLSHVGVTFSESGLTATLHEKIDGKWHEYAEIDGCASYRIDPVADRYRAKGFHLGNFFPIYDWIADDGYDNFSAWVG